MSRLMGRRGGSSNQQKAPAPKPAAVARSFPDRWWGKLLLLLATIVLLDLAFAPFKQFYLAYVALVPWLIVVRHCRSAFTAFWWSWLGGVMFFSANMWWLAYVTGPGMAALFAVVALYWAVPGAIIRGTKLLDAGADETHPPCRWLALAGMFLVAATWTSFEWFRATWPLGGLAWGFLGHTQSPVLHLAQIADFSGVYGISFWVMALNAAIAMGIIHRKTWTRTMIPAAVAMIVLVAGVLGYGFFRFSQQTTHPGPTVLVVQPNYPQSNSGEKGASFEEIVDFHLRHTAAALAAHPKTDLVVWSETMMPPLNPEASRYALSLRSLGWNRRGAFWAMTVTDLAELARQFHTAILAGGMYQNDWRIKTDANGDQFPVPADRRNAAYLFTSAGLSGQRYDKIHLVPFGEYLPFESTIPPLYHLFLALSPYTEEYTLTAGAPNDMTVFQLRPDWRFVTPICFEDMDGELVRRMFKAPDGSGKRADFIINITNDGWFRFNEMPQHLQAGLFRSIENRVPTARSVNTGISGFVDSLGRTHDLIPAGQEGTSVATLDLDSRVTFYTRFGDLFAYACATVTFLWAVGGIVRWWKKRRRSSPT
jgi:apolipoprotein N-acyltransferase